MIRRVLAGSYPSGPSSLPMPEIWRQIVADEIAAYNVPSGILFDLQRDAAAKRPGVLTKVGLGTFVDPDLQGCAMNPRAAAEPIVRKAPTGLTRSNATPRPRTKEIAAASNVNRIVVQAPGSR